MNGDLTFWQRAGQPPTAGAMSGYVPDVLGNGFPDYKSDPTVIETQTIGDKGGGADETDFGSGLKTFLDGVKSFGKSGETTDPGSAIGNGISGILKGATNAIGSAAGAVAGPWLTKGVFLGLGAVFLAAGLWAIFKSAPQENPSATE